MIQNYQKEDFLWEFCHPLRTDKISMKYIIKYQFILNLYQYGLQEQVLMDFGITMKN